jgi:ABC-type branched-subunit amino acid transport system permease subunit
MATSRRGYAGKLAAAALVALAAGVAAALLSIESERGILLLLLVVAAAAILAARSDALGRWSHDGTGAEGVAGATAAVSILALCVFFREDHFTLFLVGRVLLVTLACLGLHLQFGGVGVANFAGAAFFGVGGYTAAVLSSHSRIPHLLVLLAGGIAAALVGSVLLLPLLRTRGHYAALITVAFGLLFRTFVEVNDSLGGPQGLKLGGVRLLGSDFNEELALGPLRGSFYTKYVLLAGALLGIAFLLLRRLERSWIGLALDAVRLDETAAASFGMALALWKILAFTLGNFLIGVAGALSAFMVGFLAPNNFTFPESLALVSIVLLGGIGNAWGVAAAAFIVMVLPEKLQVIQEYRFLIYAGLVILILRFRPGGLIPRPARRYFGEPV